MKKKILQALNYGDYEVMGKSWVYNQFLNLSSIVARADWNGVKIEKSGNNIIHISGTITVDLFSYGGTQQILVGTNHKIFVHTTNSALTYLNLQCRQARDGYSTRETRIIDSSENDGIYQIINDYDKFYVNNYKQVGAGTNLNFSYQLQLIDLTLLEQQLGIAINTIDDFYATEVGQLVKQGIYLPYSATNKRLDIQSPFTFVGDNLFDKSKAITDYILDNNGEIFSPSRRNVFVSDFIPCKPNTAYNFIGGGFAYYDSNKVFIGGQGGKSEAILRRFTTASNAAYMRVDSARAGILDDIMLVEGTTSKPYRKYINRTFAPTNPIVLRGVGNVKDTWRNTNGKKKENVGNVDLGSLDWNYDMDNNLWLCQSLPNNMKTHVFEINYVPNCISDKYKTISNSAVYSREGISISTVIRVKNNSSTEKPSGNLIYELATPTTQLLSSRAFPKGITHIYDANNIEIDFIERN